MTTSLYKYTPYSPRNTQSLHPLKLIIIMVGLPARGKSYLSKQLAKYLNEHNLNTEIFNVGNTRRAEDGSRDASFFSASNQENVKLREKFAIDTLNELLHWLYNDLATDNVAILDATNSTVIRRIALMNTIDTYDSKNEVNNTDILFLENIVDDEHIIHNNIISKLMLSPDYNDSKGKDSIAYDSTAVQGGGVSDYLALNPEQIGAFKDFQERLVNYERAYETIDTDELVLLKEGNNDNIKMIKLYNYGGTFMKAGDISLFNVMTGSQLIHSKKLDSKKDYIKRILEFLLGYRYEYSTPPENISELKSNRINYHCIIK